MAKRLFKHPLFLGGFLFVVFLFIASLAQSVFFDGIVPSKFLLYDDQGSLIGRAPFSPAQIPPLGTNQSGQFMFYKLLLGAKYTIGIAVFVAGIRVIISFIVGMFYGNFFIRFSRYAAGLVNSFYYAPVSLLCFLILNDVLIKSPMHPFRYSVETRIIFELAILILVALPTTSLLIGNQIDQAFRQEFMDGVKILGGGRFYRLRRHVLPFLLPRLYIQFTEQVVQTLVLLVHLGVFHLLFGGTQVLKFSDHKAYISISGEWSGLIGNFFGLFAPYPWLLLEALGAFTLVILAFNYMGRGLKEALLEQKRVSRTKKAPQSKDDDPGLGQKELSFEPARDRAL